jgi:hypothetical protein
MRDTKVTELQKIIRYIVSRYPESKLSESRLIKILYLADWRSAILYSKQITEIKWFLNESGLRPNLNIEIPKKTLFHIDDFPFDSKEKEILDHAIKTSATKDLTDLISIVYSTYPILGKISDRNKELNLVQLAELYKNRQNEQIQKDKTLFDTDAGIQRE